MSINHKRTQIIYGNCSVYSPEGELMFRCLPKRAKWYLDRGLADIIEEDPLSIKLNFQPNGKGERADFLRLPRENQCIVCGTTDLVVLSKHHLVPYEYRKHFPEAKKSSNSVYVVPICRKDHDDYESFALELKRKIAQEYNAPLNINERVTKSKALGHITALIRYGSEMPVTRIEAIRKTLFDELQASHNITMCDLCDNESLRSLHRIMDAEHNSINGIHGKMVVNQLSDIDAFVKMWVKHFFDTMKPRHASDGMRGFFGID